MKADEIRRLLSEYAAGTISEADRRELMLEATRNQVVFEAVFAEQPLAELLTNPSARAELRAALAEQRPRGIFARLWRPWRLAAMATAVVALFAILIGRQVPLPEKRIAYEVAESRPAVAPQMSQELPVRAEDADAAKKFLARKPEGAKESAPTLRDKKQTRAEAAPKTENLDEVAPAKVSQPPAPLPELAELRKDEKAGEIAPVQTAESQLATPPGRRSRENVPGGAVGGVIGGLPGGVVGGVVGGIAPPGERPADREAERKRSVELRAATSTDVDLRLPAAMRQLGGYQLLKRTGDADFFPVSPETVFRPGDVIQLEYTLPASGYLQAAERVADGTWRLLYPQAGSRPLPLAAGSTIRLLESGAQNIGTPLQHRHISIFITAEPRLEWFQPAGAGVPRGTIPTTEILVRIEN